MMGQLLSMVALLAEGVDRNTFCSQNRTAENGSPSSRRAWIEIQRQGQRHPARHVALLAEGVDRNCQLAEGILCREVALLAEGVDRNDERNGNFEEAKESPSSRRAWIEISRV